MLDAHPNIWGMGEDSTFNANLSHFRDQLVAASSSTDIPTSVSDIINDYGTAVIKDMIQLSSNENKTIFHIVDKMLTNYRNIGESVRLASRMNNQVYSVLFLLVCMTL
jgi:hypothetical protein